MPNSLTEIIGKHIKTLSAAGIESPALDARILTAHALNCDRTQLLADSNRALSEHEISAVALLIERRTRREPVSRIIGEREFWGLPFHLNEATLDPRPDSETLIETAIKLMQAPPQTILDIGTGTGCLLLALLHEYVHAAGTGIDISQRAVEMASHNAGQLQLSVRATFRINDGLNGITERFDLIVCNPPYISSTEIPSLMPEVKDYDPVAALDGGKRGMDFYERLIPQIPNRLNNNGLAIFEVGQGQADDVCAIFTKTGLTNIGKHKDLSGIERCVSASI